MTTPSSLRTRTDHAPPHPHLCGRPVFQGRFLYQHPSGFATECPEQTLFRYKPVDFVWLDGGHSIETIRSDWENIKRCLTPDAVVFFDDYFEGGGIDTTVTGCNSLLAELKHEILPIKDWVIGGGTTQMVRVFP